MKLSHIMLVGFAVIAGGCSSNPLPSLTTGSLFGAKPDAAAAAVPAAPVVKNDPTSRALQVARVSARAKICGYNFDPAKLKANFLAAESAGGIDVAEIAKIEKIYGIAVNGVNKAITSPEEYCTEAKTKDIKAELTRHLAGDYTPTPPKKEDDEGGGGLFGSFGSGGGDAKPKSFGRLPTDNSDI